jgi:hypothetical protein
MNRKLVICSIVIALSVFMAEASARKTVAPFGRPRIVAFDNYTGKPYTYYCLVKEQSMGFAIEGPADVDIRTRAGLLKPDITADYQIQVWEEQYLVAAEKFKSKKIDGEINNSYLFPAAYRRVSFQAPAGLHNYRLWLVSDNIDTVFLRIYQSETASDTIAKVAMYPLEYFKRVHLYSKKNQTPYYLVNKSEGVKLKVTGPADLIIRTRANFTNDLDGRIGYALAMMEDGEEVSTLSTTTSKSLTMAYQDYTGVVPSKPTEFVVNIPAGDHTYTFLLKESAAETVSIRFSLPKQEDEEDASQ